MTKFNADICWWHLMMILVALDDDIDHAWLWALIQLQDLRMSRSCSYCIIIASMLASLRQCLVHASAVNCLSTTVPTTTLCHRQLTLIPWNFSTRLCQMWYWSAITHQVWSAATYGFRTMCKPSMAAKSVLTWAFCRHIAMQLASWDC